MRARPLTVLVALAGCALAGCGTLQPDHLQPDSSQPPPTDTPQLVTFELHNDGLSSVYLYQGCTLDLTITELSDPPRVVGRAAGCGVCDCSAASCPAVACGACFEGALEVPPSGQTTYQWSSVDMSYESRGTVQCSHTRVLPPGRYRLDVPVFATQAEAEAKVLPRPMSQTFELPAAEKILVKLPSNPF